MQKSPQAVLESWPVISSPCYTYSFVQQLSCSDVFLVKVVHVYYVQ